MDNEIMKYKEWNNKLINPIFFIVHAQTIELQGKNEWTCLWRWHCRLL